MNLMLTGLNKITNDFHVRSAAARHRILVCAGTGCLVNGSLKVYEAFVNTLKESGLNASSSSRKRKRANSVAHRLPGVLPDRTSRHHPAGEHILHEGQTRRRCRNSGNDDTEGRRRGGLLYVGAIRRSVPHQGRDPLLSETAPLRAFQLPGAIDPESIDEYIASGGYRQAIRAYLEMSRGDLPARLRRWPARTGRRRLPDGTEVGCGPA